MQINFVEASLSYHLLLYTFYLSLPHHHHHHHNHTRKSSEINKEK